MTSHIDDLDQLRKTLDYSCELLRGLPITIVQELLGGTGSMARESFCSELEYLADAIEERLKEDQDDG